MFITLFQVNFDEEDEDELAETQEKDMRESVRLSNTPLRPIISAAEGARAISTPAGKLYAYLDLCVDEVSISGFLTCDVSRNFSWSV